MFKSRQYEARIKYLEDIASLCFPEKCFRRQHPEI